jgi:hypothetical protein
MSDTVLAALIAGGATLVSAFLHFMNSQRSSKAAAARPQAGVRSLFWMATMIVAAGVAGFAYAEYRAAGPRSQTELLRNELSQHLQALAASTARLEKLAPAGGTQAAQQRGLDGLAAVVALPACKGPQVGFATGRPACTEQDAVQISICTQLPAGASVSAVELFVRSEDSQQPWSEARIGTGQALDGGRFATGLVERPDADGSRQVCQAYSHWSDKARTVRMLVRYVV